MQLNFSQQMKMSQQMKLAPRMIQSMEILQLPLMELNERIEQELAENVVLENAQSEEEQGDAEVESRLEEAPEEPRVKDVEQRELIVDNEHNNEADFERLLEMSGDWSDDNFAESSRPSSNRSRISSAGAEPTAPAFCGSEIRQALASCGGAMTQLA